MFRMIAVSFVLALQNIRDNFLHTVLSVLGIVIGVAALVAILSFIDGIEKYAREEIASTSSLHAIIIKSRTGTTVDGVQMKKEAYGYFTYNQLKKLEESLSYPAKAYVYITRPQVISLGHPDSTLGIALLGAVAAVSPKVEVLSGRIFKEEELAQKKKAVIVNEKLAKKLTGTDKPEDVIGQELVLKDKNMQVIGVVKGMGQDVAQAIIPITHFTDEEFKEQAPTVVVEAQNVEHVTKLKEEIEPWLKNNLAKQEGDFEVITNEYRLEQFSKAFMIFKVVMGMITGIAVLVGGIGIMNVLLISVTERTVEIGVRKAVGAKKRDIVLQFLSESITVSSFGSLLGLVLGVLATMAAVPIVRHFSNAPFEAAYTLSTMVLVAIIAVLLGVIFGTYPALRASRLDPVEAIRRE